MAEHLEDQATRRDHASGVQAWKDVLAYLPAIAVVGGLLLYGLLSLSYHEFYRSLGVDPNDVGLTYVGTLARSSGFILFWLLTAFYLFIILVAGPRPTAAQRRFRIWLFFILTPLLLVTGSWGLVTQIHEAANAVKAGKAVQPIASLVPGPLAVLAIHADPATVEPTGKPGESPAADRLRSAKLLYLGQAGGTVVFYSPAAKGPLYVPASSIIMQLANCSAMPRPDPACPPPGESY